MFLHARITVVNTLLPKKVMLPILEQEWEGTKMPGKGHGPREAIN